MFKVLDPDGIIIGVYTTIADIPEKLWNRSSTYSYPKKACTIVEVTDLKDKQKLQRTLEECMNNKE